MGDTAKTICWSECMTLMKLALDRPGGLQEVWPKLERRMQFLRELLDEDSQFLASPTNGSTDIMATLRDATNRPHMASIADAVVWVLEHNNRQLRFSQLFEQVQQTGVLVSASNVKSPAQRLRICLQAQKRHKRAGRGTAGVEFRGAEIGDDTMIKLAKAAS